MLSRAHVSRLKAQGQNSGPRAARRRRCDALFTSDEELGTSEAQGIETTPVILALVIGIIAGCGVLWLDHAGLIALRNLDASCLLVTMKAGVRD